MIQNVSLISQTPHIISKNCKHDNCRIKSNPIKDFQPIFIIKKFQRNGLLEKKKMKNQKILQSGKWSREEHSLFINASLKYGSNWRKVN